MFDPSLNRVNKRLNRTLARNTLLQKVADDLQRQLQANRVVLYYFYRQWKGQVVIESLSHDHFSILGSTGADDCFNDKHAAWYLAGRVLNVADVEQAGFESCHLDFLRSIDVRADLVVPIVIGDRLWGFIAVHQRTVREWLAPEVEFVKTQARFLAKNPILREESKQIVDD